MDDHNPRVNRKRLRILWLALFIPVAIGVHHFYYKAPVFRVEPAPLISGDQTSSVSASNAAVIQSLKDVVEAASQRASVNDVDALISRADQTIADTDQLLSTLNVDRGHDQKTTPTDETRQLRDQIESLKSTTL